MKLALLFLAVALPTITNAATGASILSSDYDSSKQTINLQIVNVSQPPRDITAIVIRSSGSENVIDFLPLMLSVSEARAEGADISDAHGKITGNRTFQPTQVITHTMDSHARQAEITVSSSMRMEPQR